MPRARAFRRTDVAAAMDDAERARRDGPEREGWLRFGPYLSERQWSSVREDTTTDPDSWRSFPHDHARSRIYRHGEDGIAGISDDRNLLCLALSQWNERDPILKERFFGLTNDEGNHGEDAKEYWFHTDATPTASYLRLLYKYPQTAFPYQQLIDTNASLGRDDPEFELLDTGIFDDDRYFDVDVEIAKAAPDDLVMRVTAHNRGPDPAPLHLLPTLWFRNTWSGPEDADTVATVSDEPRPALRGLDATTVEAQHPRLGVWTLQTTTDAALLFCDNETDTKRLWGRDGVSAFPRGGIGDHVTRGTATVNPDAVGTKVGAHHIATVPAGGTMRIHVRLRRGAGDEVPGMSVAECDEVIAVRVAEADEFYASLRGPDTSDERALVLRRALAGMIWCKQYYEYPVARWLRDRGQRPFAERNGRNARWAHVRAGAIISMPDSWEYPWFAAWDLAFHTLPLALVDLAFAKQQLELLLDADYLHPDGQIPAYEWGFDDVNPPVHAWAALNLYAIEGMSRGQGDVGFLTRVFDRLLLNFTWWVNRKDADGNDIFQGGFLGLDNIGVFDRSAPLPTGGVLEQSDGTAWMAGFAQAMAKIAAELAVHDASYLPLARKFAEHYLWIAAQVYGTSDGAALWDDDDRFFYDSIRFDDGNRERLRVRSIVGLLPLAASVTVHPGPGEGDGDGDDGSARGWLAGFVDEFADFLPLLRNLPAPAADGRVLVSLVDEYRVRSLLRAMLDEAEFLSPHGIRSLSRRHLDQPYVFSSGAGVSSVAYVPGDSDSPMFGGNSNWRGPVWMPVNVLLVRGLVELHEYYGPAFTVEFPTGSGNEATLLEVARSLAARLISLFERGDDGRRPSHGSHPVWSREHWRDQLLFFEYFHGDDGSGRAASHQTGWTGLVALLIFLLGDEDGLRRLVG
ncbi:MGH1-like glycoside hydrolase domain-containing protein [Microbacterium sp.]|uniref:MGH1-like glycoside hydrolase domain-containing protein n=1 Tax=Microbacterium sp. TaxID=51671 RepID=UPI003C739F4E